jgi:hypothetical protein
MGPTYPRYPSQPNVGNLPTMFQMGPPDLRATSTTAPYYNRKLLNAHGRHLAGTEDTVVQDERHAQDGWAFNELRVMAEMDDVQGNGIFDPPGAQKNLHEDAGVFAQNFNIPGMHAREVPYGFSEEVDVTTGRRVRAVPSGAVANDSAAQIAFVERGLYAPPVPLLKSAMETTRVPRTGIYNVMQNPVSMSGVAEDQQNMKLMSIALIGAAVAGLYYFYVRPQKA